MNAKLEGFLNREIGLIVTSEKVHECLMRWCEKQGLKWCSGTLPTNVNPYNVVNADYTVWINTIGCLIYCHNPKHRDMEINHFITLEDFNEDTKNEFTKENLETGMVVKTRDGNYFMVLTGDLMTVSGKQNIVLISDEWYITENCLTTDLLHYNNKYLDVVEVYKPTVVSLQDTIKKLLTGSLIWRRASEKESILRAKIKETQAEVDASKRKIEELRHLLRKETSSAC